MDRYCICAKVLIDSAFKTKAKVIILSHNNKFCKASGISKDRKRIRKYIPLKRLTNFKPQFIHRGIEKEKIDPELIMEKEYAIETSKIFNKQWSNVRVFFNGKLIKKGTTPKEAKEISWRT